MALSTSSSPPSGDGGGGGGGLDEAAASTARRCVAARRGRGAGKETRLLGRVVAAGDGVGGGGGRYGSDAAIFTVYRSRGRWEESTDVKQGKWKWNVDTARQLRSPRVVEIFFPPRWAVDASGTLVWPGRCRATTHERALDVRGEILPFQF